MPDQAATEVEGVLWCVAHCGVADETQYQCDMFAGAIKLCDFRRIFIDPRPEAQVQR